MNGMQGHCNGDAAYHREQRGHGEDERTVAQLKAIITQQNEVITRLQDEIRKLDYLLETK